MTFDLDPKNPAQVRAYAEQIAEVVMSGIATGA
jgi:hypothetical protein